MRIRRARAAVFVVTMCRALAACGGVDATSQAEDASSDASRLDAGSHRDTGVTDSTVDTRTPDTNVPETNAPDINAPETNVPDASTPDTSTPDTSTPDT